MANFPTTVQPSYGALKSSAPSVRVALFGSGYSQRSVYGINQDLKIWNFIWENISETDADEIENFLEARGGAESFSYQPQGEAASKKYICIKWSKYIPFLNRATINATFQQVAEA
jgi:phage-related protein|tara:strand:- start:233 stop:577 length:345 start_codon:yes stop_codon:yes gene_type:complete